jgi:HEAT repeat protein
VNASENNGIAQSLSEAVLLAVAQMDREGRERAIASAAETADPKGLVTLISTEDVIRRNAALEALTKAGRRGVPELLRALDDPDPEVVMFAASTLGKTLDLTAIPHLERILNHPDINVCQAAIESLGSLRATSTLGALGGLLQRDTWLRFSVVHTLGEIGDPRSARTLIELLGDDDVRDSAISSLGKIGGIEVIEELVRRLERAATLPEFSLYLSALGNALTLLPNPSALRQLPFWTAFAGRADRTVAPRLTEILRTRTAQEAGEASVEAAIDLIRSLRLRSCFAAMVSQLAEDERFTEHLLFAAADIGTPLLPYLSPGLSHHDPQVRRFACLATAAAALDEGSAALTALVEDSDEAVRIVVVKLLARLHHTDGIAQIVERLEDQASAVRAAAVEALCKMDAHLVSMALLGKPERLAERHQIVLAIMRANPHPLQRGFLEASLRDRRAEVREAAVAALAAQREVDLASPLEPMLADPSLAVRRAALGALAGHHSERIRQMLLRVLEQDSELRNDVIVALGKLRDHRVIRKVTAAFDAWNPEQQAYAIEMLGTTESPSAEPFVAQQLGNQDPRVRRAAVRALARLGTSSALRRISVALRDEDPKVRVSIAKAVASCPHPIARYALERLCLDPVESVAEAARAQLGR